MDKGEKTMKMSVRSGLFHMHGSKKRKISKKIPDGMTVFVVKSHELYNDRPACKVCRQTDIPQKSFDDRNLIIYVNGEVLTDSPQKTIEHHAKIVSADKKKCKSFIDWLHDVKKLERGKKLDALIDDIYDEGQQESYKKGHRDGRIETYSKLVCKHTVKYKCALQETLKVFDVPKEDAAEVIERVKAELAKQGISIHTSTDDAGKHRISLKAQASIIRKFMQIKDCTLDEAFEFFEVSEANRKELMPYIQS